MLITDDLESITELENDESTCWQKEETDQFLSHLLKYLCHERYLANDWLSTSHFWECVGRNRDMFIVRHCIYMRKNFNFLSHLCNTYYYVDVFLFIAFIMTMTVK